jgi:hypothetical protein
MLFVCCDFRGNLLEDTALLTSLNDTKCQASSVAAALQDGQALAAQLDEQRSAYRWALRQHFWVAYQTLRRMLFTVLWINSNLTRRLTENCLQRIFFVF